MKNTMKRFGVVKTGNLKKRRMKKAIILTLIFSFCGGASETETVEDTSSTTSSTTTSSTTTSSTTSTTIKRVEWTPSEIDLTCPRSRDLMYKSEFKAGFNVRFGSNPTQILLKFYNFEDKEEQSLEWTPSIDPTINWEKGGEKSLYFYDTESLVRDYEFFYFTVEVKDSSGVVTKECDIKNDVDIYTLPPIVETSVCPETAGQNEEINVSVFIISRTADVEYIQWEFQDDTRANNYSDLIETEYLPEKEYRLKTRGVVYPTGSFNYSGNLSIIANVYDSLGRSSKAVCGIVLEP